MFVIMQHLLKEFIESLHSPLLQKPFHITLLEELHFTVIFNLLGAAADAVVFYNHNQEVMNQFLAFDWGFPT